VIGTLGNSGMSQGAHLHLELRFGTNPNAQWPEIKSGLVTPARLFLR
jgi:murein DD-endopeptidase MepM/ murein hydrolase activator NlpD